MLSAVESPQFQTLSATELLLIDGGAWSWADFGKSTAGGAVGGAAGGAVTGSFAGGVGALPGAGIGALAGAAGGAATYLAVGWW
ncbi:Blp family class II bacteriocin [Aquibacillus rhizosphaerae]|uniref:Blp family class II bacteriocin n=1 Tax=Aquibacillus rhizosphaerae TaxID=3051431 RepID=A0ABT7KZF8_9BACI|nr:Blp family class II bacteriocin [Aquibacillus sp. LR5S19]MDL4838914.1 Blp family class II bacteriocin [Aquibacillus sp. LR5S19]